jgi:hypothetical protein
MGMYNGRAMLLLPPPPPPSPLMVLWQWQCCEVVDKRIGQQWWRTSFGADGHTLATGMVVCCCKGVAWWVVPVVGKVGRVRMVLLDEKGRGKGSTRRLSTDWNALTTGMAAFCCKTLLFWRDLPGVSHGPVLGRHRNPGGVWILILYERGTNQDPVFESGANEVYSPREVEDGKKPAPFINYNTAN